MTLFGIVRTTHVFYTSTVVYEEPYIHGQSSETHQQQTEPDMEQCPAYGVLSNPIKAK